MLAVFHFWWWFLLVGIVVTISFEAARRRRLRVYWDRRCTGLRWRRSFPAASKDDIRSFLDVFVDAFGFPRKRRLCFSPDDKVVDLYRTLYPSIGYADCFEIPTFVKTLQDRYGLDVARLPQREYTLGELFALTHSQQI